MKRTQRIKLTISAATLTRTDVFALVSALLSPIDIDFGWTMYNGRRELRADITLHEGTPELVCALWTAARFASDVDCGRVYLADGTDHCCKRLFHVDEHTLED